MAAFLRPGAHFVKSGADKGEDVEQELPRFPPHCTLPI